MRTYIITTVFLLLTVSVSLGQTRKVAEDITPLLISEQVPDVTLKNINGEPTPLKDIFSSKKTILLFYRGGWCPYCNIHLSAIGEVEKEIIELGYQVVAISPESAEYLKASIKKGKLNYSLYSDSKNDLATAMGIAFQAPDRHKDKLLKRSDGDNSGLLPVPAVFVLDTDGIILFEYISPNYRKRMSAALLLEVLKDLNK